LAIISKWEEYFENVSFNLGDKKRMKERCWRNVDGLMIEYHDTEWGVPLHDDRKLYEFLVLDGAQAGLSWTTILNKRENYRQAFDNFEFEKIAKYDEQKIQQLVQNPGIIRNRLKIQAFITNAKGVIHIRKEFGSFDQYLWAFAEKGPIDNALKSFADMPTQSPLSEKISKDLKRRGFKFVGPTIIYAFMQAIGMVNDHLVHCFRYAELEKK
jgi:DNA-3-methyladenine glycosylase I